MSLTNCNRHHYKWSDKSGSRVPSMVKIDTIIKGMVASDQQPSNKSLKCGEFNMQIDI